MTPRPRQASDEQILSGTLRAIVRMGPSRLTLAHVAAEVGISPAALVQRFGSKRGLLLALVSQGPEGSRSMIDGLRAAHRSPVAALLALAGCWAQMGTTPAEIANSLAFFQMDLTDPDFRRFAREGSTITHEGIRELLADAVGHGELADCNVDRLARALQAAMSGSLLSWAIHQEGKLREWIRRDLETVLEPYRPRIARRPKSHPTRPRT